QERNNPTFQGRIRMGPVPTVLEPEVPGQRLTGEALESAAARFNVQQGWSVAPIFTSGSPGIDDFNVIAAACNTFQASCPAGRVAIEIDGFVESAPSVNAAYFERDQITISGSFTEEEAKDLALALNFGALPLELTPQESRIVSSTLGEDALDAGVLAGLIGVLLVSIYLIAYYRYLGVVAIVSLLISGALLWTIVAWLGASQGLALTLAGVTGLIVSIGVSVDSNVVYFEHLKEDVKGGRTVRSAVERSFPIAYSTIVKANVASLIAAVVLYTLTVGQVRGFALFLGLATDRRCLVKTLRMLFRNEHHFDFPAMWRKALIGSAVLVLVSVGALVFRGLNLGIEFEGGTAWEVTAPGVSVAETRDALGGTGAESGKIQTLGSDAIRVRADLDTQEEVAAVTATLAELASVDITDVSVTTVGPSWGDQITSKARNALFWFFVIVAGYIAVRLEWKMAVGALVAVAHDILISVGVYAIFQFEVTPATVIAFLTIMGYSLYDTIVVYDKVRDVGGRLTVTGRYTYSEMMNQSL
ncbi:MAG: SecD/SecF family protein translocase subunit, partial [Actinobacteria bacterium]|nr:SecD/SecF family protein translocase subunit [Actinomycetota bacterium]